MLPSVRFPYREPRDLRPPQHCPLISGDHPSGSSHPARCVPGREGQDPEGLASCPGFAFWEHDDPVFGCGDLADAVGPDVKAPVGQAPFPAPERAPQPIRGLLSPFLAHWASHWGPPQMSFPGAELGCCLPWEPPARTLQLPRLTCAPAPHLGGLGLRRHRAGRAEERPAHARSVLTAVSRAPCWLPAPCRGPEGTTVGRRREGARRLPHARVCRGHYCCHRTVASRGWGASGLGASHAVLHAASGLRCLASGPCGPDLVCAGHQQNKAWGSGLGGTPQRSQLSRPEQPRPA